jgi:3-oxoadipate enol-lactonase
MMNFDFTARRLPTLVVCGADDPGTPRSRPPLRGTGEARHLPNVERPEAFNRIMISWLDAQRYAR